MTTSTERERELSQFIVEHLPPTSRGGKLMQRAVKRLEGGGEVSPVVAQLFYKFTEALTLLEQTTRDLEAELGPES